MNLKSISLLICLGLSVLTGCPKGQAEHETVSSEANQYTPAESVPAEGQLLEYGKLRLGMSEFEISQAYNAPKGKGDGFWRTVDRYGDVSIHTITLEAPAEGPEHKLLAQFYRDRLYRVVDRRDGMDREYADAWLAELIDQYGAATSEPLAGTEWFWEGEGLSLSYMQDNASDLYMSGRALLAHEPTVTAAQAYLQTWQEANPEHNYPEY